MKRARGNRWGITLLVIATSVAVQAAEGPRASGTISAPPASRWDVIKSQVKEWWEIAKGFVAKLEDAPARPVAKAPTVAAPTTAPAESTQGPTLTISAAPSVAPTATDPQPKAQTKPVSPGALMTPDRGTQRADIDRFVTDSKARLNRSQVLRQTQEGRMGATPLPRNAAGVPVFDVRERPAAKAKATTRTVPMPKNSLPLLDIGEEPRISASELTLGPFTAPEAELDALKPLPSPQGLAVAEWTKWAKTRIPPAQIVNLPNQRSLGLPEIPNPEKVAVSFSAAPDIQLSAVHRFTDEELNLLTALILVRKANRCDVASGLFYDLRDHKVFGREASYRLGLCAHKMGLFTEAFHRLLPVVTSEDPDWAPEAIRALIEKLPREFEIPLAKALDGLKNPRLIPKEVEDAAHYVMAKGFYKDDTFKTASKYAALVSEKSEFYEEAQFLLGIAQYLIGNSKDAERILTSLRESMAKAGKNSRNINSLVDINLARIRFQNRRFQEAHDTYLKIDKNHPLWVTALIEQGWTQLMMDDFAGAIGNMYSLHSPYFVAVYKPESFVVRTMGYINICQYGDAYRTLTQLERVHRGWLGAIEAYMGRQPEARHHYETVKTYLRGKSDQDVDGLPFTVIREIARQRGFLNHQESLNAKEDELTRFANVSERIISEKAKIRSSLQQATTRFNQAKTNLERAKKTPALAKHIDEWRASFRNERDLILGYRFQLAALERGRQGYLRLRAEAERQIETEKSGLREAAGRALAQNLKQVRNQIKQVLDNNELLRYEVFAGSGENIRYQAAGGETGGAGRLPAHVKPEKNLNWQFDGEYWEDEIGSYRSSLKNNCPTVHGGVKLTGDQAAWGGGK